MTGERDPQQERLNHADSYLVQAREALAQGNIEWALRFAYSATANLKELHEGRTRQDS